MSEADLTINRDVRRVMIRHWIDLGQLSFRSLNGRVWIRGALRRIAGVSETLTSTIVENIFDDLKRIRGVVHVAVELENWSMDGGSWRPLDKGKSKASVAQHGVVHEISDKESKPA